MLELGPFGSVRGVSGNGPPYRDPRPSADLRCGAPKQTHKGLLVNN